MKLEKILQIADEAMELYNKNESIAGQLDYLAGEIDEKGDPYNIAAALEALAAQLRIGYPRAAMAFKATFKYKRGNAVRVSRSRARRAGLSEDEINNDPEATALAAAGQHRLQEKLRRARKALSEGHVRKVTLEQTSDDKKEIDKEVAEALREIEQEGEQE